MNERDLMIVATTVCQYIADSGCKIVYNFITNEIEIVGDDPHVRVKLEDYR